MRLPPFVIRHRRPVVMVLAALLAMFLWARPTKVGDATVVVAARDLGAGTRITAADLVTTAWPTAGVPDSALTVDDLTGRVTRVRIQRGSPVLREFVSTTGSLPTIAVPLKRSAPDVRIGDTVHVWATAEGNASVLAARFAIVNTIVGESKEFGTAQGAYAILEIDPTDEGALAAAREVVLVRQP